MASNNQLFDNLQYATNNIVYAYNTFSRLSSGLLRNMWLPFTVPSIEDNNVDTLVRAAYPELDSIYQDYNLYVQSMSLSRGTSTDERIRMLNDSVRSAIPPTDVPRSTLRVLFVYTGGTSVASVKEGEDLLKESIKNMPSVQSIVDVDYRTALTVTPGTKVSTFLVNCIAKDKESKLLVVFSNTYVDDFFTRLSGILPYVFQHRYLNTPNMQALTTNLVADNKAVVQEIYDGLLEARNKIVISLRIHKALLKLETMPDPYALTIKERVHTTKDDAEHYLNMYREALRKLQELELMAFKFENNEQSANPLKVLADYIKSFKIDNVTNIEVRNNYKLRMAIKTELLYYDEDLLRILQNNPNSILRRCPVWLQQLFKDVFIDKTHKIMIHQEVELSLQNEISCGRAGDSKKYVENAQGIYHPHIGGFNCFGNNKSIIFKALKDRDYIVAFEQIIATLSGINFSDSTVIDHMISMFITLSTSTTSIAPIKKADGTLITVVEYKEEYNASN